MEQKQIRKSFQGVLNIIRFNWHFYLIAFGLLFVLFFVGNSFDQSYAIFISIFTFLVVSSLLTSLIVSWYVYDFSDLYTLDWIHKNNKEQLIVNIHAGFDETSHLLQTKFKNTALIVFDFYNPKKHTEISIKRARKTYPPFPKTKTTETTNIALKENSADKIFVILSAHEIRDEKERIAFFKELKRIIKPTGEIYITEHLRDFPNFLAYNIGAFHFYSKKTWLKTFEKAQLNIKQEIKLTPFISTFVLYKNGNTF